MKLLGVLTGSIGRLLWLIAVIQILDKIDWMIQRYLLEIEPVPLGLLKWAAIVGAFLWVIGDAWKEAGKEFNV